MIIPHKFTLIVEPGNEEERIDSVLLWKFFYRGKQYGNAFEFPLLQLQDRKGLEVAMMLLVENLMDSFEILAQEGLEDGNS